MCEACNAIEYKIKKIKENNDEMFEREFIDEYNDLIKNQCDEDCFQHINSTCDWSIKSNKFYKTYTPACSEFSLRAKNKNENFIENFIYCPYCRKKINIVNI